MQALVLPLYRCAVFFFTKWRQNRIYTSLHASVLPLALYHRFCLFIRKKLSSVFCPFALLWLVVLYSAFVHPSAYPYWARSFAFKLLVSKKIIVLLSSCSCHGGKGINNYAVKFREWSEPVDSWELRYSPKFTKQCVLWRVTARYFSQNYGATRAPLRQRETSVARPYDTDPFYPISSVHLLQTCLLKAQRLTTKTVMVFGPQSKWRRTSNKAKDVIH